MSERIEFVGKIDLEQYYRTQYPYACVAFRLLDAIVEDEKGEYYLSLYDERKKLDGCGISLIVGKNGVGKSYLFRAIIEFFIDFNWFVKFESKRPYTNSRYKIRQIRYILGNHEYAINRDGNKFTAKINGVDTSPGDIVIPNIVAAHFGLYDRFPVKRDRYDVEFYKYVGTKAGGNFISTNNIITQMLFSLCEDREETVLRRISLAFSKVGYEPKVKIRVKVRISSDIISFESFKNRIEQHANEVSTFNAYVLKRIARFTLQQKKNLYKTYNSLKSKSEITLNLEDYDDFRDNRALFSDIYLLKQLQLTSKLSFFFYRDTKELDCNSLSSGEINMLATIVSVASCVNEVPVLILLDEPELNQHPNWQMSMINHLYELFGDFRCHLFIASHSHFLVSDLPGEKSVVIQMDYSDSGLIGKILPENTYGWSAEQVLLEVFQTGTDRNLYLSHMVGTLLDKIKCRELDISSVKEELDYLKRVSENLKDFDPLKKIIISLSKAFTS